ncbi:uncharacterized protein M437DRAFT_60210 [Aureobasidium melanogenum CBS 110374]|uniref:Cupin 2 conserved barrel domain-containing protein n=1 Tax=Aureobasidium melanogenum (strain CBS 110374) TaxID=1043003 RepID=A0A074VKF1_AURM1|nr:uncharacterized protein M437DRAFT_60210 [Aureobasidium melanogenum CBS 110374]KEQ58092.1 hypothetical protein M437DRAFT_60210 [Aureobasidium melanogenum CBS 110374]
MSFVRTKTAESDSLISCDGARTTKWQTPRSGNSVLEIQTYPDSSKITKTQRDILRPPLHWHWHQKEFFTVTQGTFIFTLNGKETKISATDPNPRISITPGAPHTFTPDPSHKGPCVIEISAETSPLSSEITATDLDCTRQNVSPSLPQLLLFLDSAEVSLAWDVGPTWLMHYLSYGLGVVVGRWIGGGLLGYKGSYPEYYNPELNETKKGK